MNEIDVRSKPHQGQYIGQFRRVHKAEYETVQKDGEPILFPTRPEAELAAFRAMTAHLSTLMRRDGCTVADTARQAAEKLFARDHGKGKADDVEERAGSSR